MILWRRNNKKNSGRGSGTRETLMDLVIPTHFQCPISLDLMKDPVTMSTGITYDRESIETWLESGNMTCPVTKQVLRTLEPVPNHTIRRMIQDWCVENQAYGVERIPTPRVPVTSNEVGWILTRILATHEAHECRELVGKLGKVMKESERNRKCIVENGSGRVLATIFESFAKREGESDVVSLLEDVMTILTSMISFEEEAIEKLKSTNSLEILVRFLNHGGLSERRNSVVILKELVSSLKDGDQVELLQRLVKTQGVEEGLVKLIKEPICPTSTKASLMVIYNMMEPSQMNETITLTFVEMGLVQFLLELLVGAEKGTCEKALGVLDQLIAGSKAGLKVARAHALAVPLVVKKILRVSDLATEFSVSVLWRLSEGEERQRVAEEALQVGAFQKLLLILQVGWNSNQRTREKVTKLLKLLNGYRGRVECTESMDFKEIKKSF